MTEGYRQRLHQARTDAGMSQRALAERIGCSDSTISQVETGQRELTASKLFSWAQACQVSLDWIAWDAPRSGALSAQREGLVPA